MKWTLRIAIIFALIALLLGASYSVRPEPEKPALAHPDAPVNVLRPELVPVCACESSYEGRSWGTPQQFEPDGKTVRYGRVDPQDRGMCQISRRYHAKAADALGLDLDSEAGNIAYANLLFEQSGFKPWTWSYDPERKKCHWE